MQMMRFNRIQIDNYFSNLEFIMEEYDTFAKSHQAQLNHKTQPLDWKFFKHIEVYYYAAAAFGSVSQPESPLSHSLCDRRTFCKIVHDDFQ
ncbi:hypothetical protein CDAR_570931 [Caerostris darwini]|uniref:Uncharacterized protein n=1 Tax=Caerostris darwini TaxID=1538125 RepID=A0AAV4P6J8_9ARAC|nr:hypothetical protein CDAR_570931 [Caerostris darwini]